MPIDCLAEITIDDSDIDEVEKLLGNVVFDKQRRDVIKSLDTIDVQAFPGSGKTTILVAKLAILAKKWPYTNRGICVLSHTNVASEEIEKRLSATDIGRKLLSYPHFIGTFHSFFDKYIGLPWLRSKGCKRIIIDTDLTLSRRWGKLPNGTKIFLAKKGFSEDACESKNYPLSFDIKCKESTASYKEVKRCVKNSFREGFFTFNEMLYIARYVIKQLTHLPQSIQTRFPFVLVDEAQDTSALQLEILDAAFPDKSLSIINLFGDCNQAIFQSFEKETNEFPRRHSLTVESSKRFGNKIAQLADPLSLNQRGMTGECGLYAKNDMAHTVFLFDRKNASMVLPAYAKHILHCFTEQEIQENIGAGCHAVGMVHSKEPLEENAPHFPASIADYWQQYNPLAVEQSPKPKHLIDFFRAGNSAFVQTHDMNDLVEWVSKGLKRYIATNSLVCLSLSSFTFRSLLNHLPINSHADFRTAFMEIVSLPISTKVEWNAVVTKIHESVDAAFDIPHAKTDFLRWIAPSACFAENKPASSNCYRYSDNETGREVDIHLGSIHSVKGRTHLATLIMETFWHNHNIKSILPWLYNEPPKGAIKAQNEMRLKCHYVALTRAKGLICIAIPQDSIDENTIDKLTQVGWSIERI